MLFEKGIVTMSAIKQEELFQHLSGFLRSRGIELQEGAYTRRIQQGCRIVTEAANLSQRAMQKTKAEVDKRLEQVRQVIHEKTAPRTAPPCSCAGAGEAPEAPSPKTARPRPGAQKAKPARSKTTRRPGRARL